jgi:hypothetical protein
MRRHHGLLAVIAAAISLGGCTHCDSSDPGCEGKGAPTAAELRSLMSPASVRQRLQKLERWVGPRVGGVAFTMYGEIWVSLSSDPTEDVGIDAKGSRISVDYAAGRSPDQNPDWDPIRKANVPLREVDWRFLPLAIARLQRRYPHQFFESARVDAADGGGLVWDVQIDGDTAKAGGPTDYYANGDGAGFCQQFPSDQCPQSLDSAF